MTTFAVSILLFTIVLMASLLSMLAIARANTNAHTSRKSRLRLIPFGLVRAFAILTSATVFLSTVFGNFAARLLDPKSSVAPTSYRMFDLITWRLNHVNDNDHVHGVGVRSFTLYSVSACPLAAGGVGA
jgi:hypothetical protein